MLSASSCTRCEAPSVTTLKIVIRVVPPPIFQSTYRALGLLKDDTHRKKVFSQDTRAVCHYVGVLSGQRSFNTEINGEGECGDV